MSIPILAHEAVVKTATVEVRSLTITGKQVTLAVFRQLQEEDLVDYFNGFELAGVPWGHVNYHPDKGCADEGRHLHVVWQKGEELRRALVVWNGWRYQHRALADRLREMRNFIALAMCQREKVFEHDATDGKVTPIIERYYGGKNPVTVAGNRWRMEVDNEVARLISQHQRFPESFAQGVRERAEKARQHYYGLLEGTHTLREYFDAITRDQDTLDGLRRRWESIYNKLYDAGQLFIAV